MCAGKPVLGDALGGKDPVSVNLAKLQTISVSVHMGTVERDSQEAGSQETYLVLFKPIIFQMSLSRELLLLLLTPVHIYTTNFVKCGGWLCLGGRRGETRLVWEGCLGSWVWGEMKQLSEDP